MTVGDAHPISGHARFRCAAIGFHLIRGREFPWRGTSDPYAVLIGELLLQRTRAEQVEPVYREFLRRWPSAAALGRARSTSLRRVLHPLGLTKRAEQIERLAVALGELEEVPGDPDTLALLPGVGPYVAHAVPVFAAQ